MKTKYLIIATIIFCFSAKQLFSPTLSIGLTLFTVDLLVLHFLFMDSAFLGRNLLIPRWLFLTVIALVNVFGGAHLMGFNLPFSGQPIFAILFATVLFVALMVNNRRKLSRKEK